MKKHLLNFLKLAISLGLGIGLIYWFVSKMSEEDKALTLDAFQRADYFWILLAPLIGMFSNFSRAQRWRMLLQPTGHYPGFANTWFSIMSMYFFNLFFPRLGEVTRCTVLARYENVPLDKSIGTMVVERVVDLISIMIVGGTLLLIEYDRLFAFFEQNVLNKKEVAADSNPWVKWAIAGGVVLAIAIGAWFLNRKYGFAKIKAMLKERLMGFAEGLKSIRYVKSPVEFIFHSILIWVCYFLMVYVSFPALPETKELGVLAAAACLFFGGFAIAATPGGIGVYPLFLQQVLILYGVNATIGYAFGSVVWVAQMGSIFVGGLVSLAMLALLNRNVAPAKD